MRFSKQKSEQISRGPPNAIHVLYLYQYTYRAARAFVALTAAIFECLIYISNLYITNTYININIQEKHAL